MRAISLALAMACCAASCGRSADDRLERTDAEVLAPIELPPPVTRFDRCERCHVAIGAAHARSLHARAAIDPLFRRELARVPDPALCVGCHGADREPAGMGCDSCHGVDGEIRAAHSSGRAPHPVRVDPTLGSDEDCARCHQFDFPGRPGERMQATLDEAMLLGPERPRCITCHAGTLGHTFELSDAMLAASITATATARRESAVVRVRVVLRAGGVGHAVPTGDVYRRLEVRAWLVGVSGSLRTETLSRVFRRELDGLHELDDRRVPPGGARAVELALPLSDRLHASEVRWAVEWHALPREELERSDETSAPIDERWWRRDVAAGRIDL